MSLFGGLYVGSSGLRNSQNALNTVAHNLSNINTPGYVRQQVALADTHYTKVSTRNGDPNQQAGLGVQYSEVRHVRDYFLDKTYREESGRYSFYETSYSAVLEVEDILGELDGAAFKESMESLWTAFEELSKSPEDPTNISLLVQSSASFIENATSVYQSFKEYQANLNTQIKDAVDAINEIGKSITQLNEEISKIESGGVEKANDLRDVRDQLLDTLAGYGNISYDEDVKGMVNVRLYGEDFITEKTYNEILLLEDTETGSGFYTPYWSKNLTYMTDEEGNRIPDYNSALVVRTTTEISALKDTDIGTLRSLLLARGDHYADYTDLDASCVTQRKLDALEMTEEEYLANAEENQKTYYNDHIMNSIIMNVQSQFDNVVHAIATKINDVLASHCDPKSGYLCNPDGTPMQMFVKTEGEAYEKISSAEYDALVAEGGSAYPIYNAKGEATGLYWKYIEEDANVKVSLYNCEGMEINQELVQVPALLGFMKVDGSADYNLGTAFINSFAEEGLYLNPNSTAESSFEGCYVDLVNQQATLGNIYKQMYEFEQLSTEQIDGNRQSVIGASSDEELEHMIMYQNAYNAASRYINVINTMLDSLLSMAM
ncbi:MAG: flagellar hook-associated protein FlgK [Lachnospiraceae bacterium]|nr:flagellar hook-associated protein FlgK [Lachnospiraceae bacterium]